MSPINIRYGQSLTIPVSSDDEAATNAVMFVGKAGEVPEITIPTTLTNGVGSFEFTVSDTMIPLGEYNYQINIEHSDGTLEKYPEPEDCEGDGLPTFTVHEALDEQEVS